MEDVALTVSPGWTQLDSSQVNFYGDKRQENCGSLTSLGKTNEHWSLLKFPGFLCILASTRLLEAVWIMFGVRTTTSESQLLTGYVTSLLILLSLQFSSVKFSHSVVSDSLWPHESQLARPPCLSRTPGVYSNSCPSSRWCHLAISSPVVPFSSCPQSFPASGSFPMSLAFLKKKYVFINIRLCLVFFVACRILNCSIWSL